MKKNILRSELADAISEVCEQLYNKEGIQSVISYCDKMKLNYRYCNGCENEMPIIETVKDVSCAVCGSN